MAIDRPDWNGGTGDRALVSTSLPGQTVGGNSIVSSDDYYEASTQAPLVEAEFDLTDEQQEMAVAVGRRLVVDCPDPAGWDEAMEDLSEEAHNLISSVLISKLPRSMGDLIYHLEAKATLARTVELREWVQGLPEHLKAWLVAEWEDGER